MKFSIGSFRLKLDGAMRAVSHALPAQIQAAPYATLPARSLRLNAGQAPHKATHFIFIATLRFPKEATRRLDARNKSRQLSVTSHRRHKNRVTLGIPASPHAPRRHPALPSLN